MKTLPSTLDSGQRSNSYTKRRTKPDRTKPRTSESTGQREVLFGSSNGRSVHKPLRTGCNRNYVTFIEVSTAPVARQARIYPVRSETPSLSSAMLQSATTKPIFENSTLCFWIPLFKYRLPGARALLSPL